MCVAREISRLDKFEIGFVEGVWNQAILIGKTTAAPVSKYGSQGSKAVWLMR